MARLSGMEDTAQIGIGAVADTFKIACCWFALWTQTSRYLPSSQNLCSSKRDCTSMIVLELNAGGGEFGSEDGVEGVDFAVEVLPKVLAYRAIMSGLSGEFGRCRSGFSLG